MQIECERLLTSVTRSAVMAVSVSFGSSVMHAFRNIIAEYLSAGELLVPL